MRQQRTTQAGGGDVMKGLAAGVAGGLVAAWAMNQFQAWWSRAATGTERSHGAQSLQQGAPPGSVAPGRPAEDERLDATERVASALSEGVAGRELSEGEKEAGGALVHYAFGAATGAAYGAAAEFAPAVTAGAGAPFGALVWLAADEGVVPALGLSKPPTEYPLWIHAYALASHAVYGLTAEVVRRAVRRAL